MDGTNKQQECDKYLQSLLDLMNVSSWEQLREALLGILELHQTYVPPKDKQWVSGGPAPHCRGCSTGDPFDDATWPCETVQTINSILNERSS